MIKKSNVRGYIHLHRIDKIILLNCHYISYSYKLLKPKHFCFFAMQFQSTLKSQRLYLLSIRVEKLKGL